MSDETEVLFLVDELRKRGAIRIRVGQVEADFAMLSPDAPGAEEPLKLEDIDPEEVEKARKDKEDAMLFGSSG